MNPRRRWLGRLAFGGGFVVAVAAVLIGIWYWAAGSYHPPVSSPPAPTRPTSQPASCPDVQVLAVPGTWESRADDDPHSPHADAKSLIGFVTRPLQRQFPGSRADVYTVPYVAQFSNPLAFPPDGQASYNVSRTQGEQRATQELADMAQKCPLTSYVLTGFSQGAVIVGDVAASIGAGNGPVAADRVLGVTLIADGRRDEGQGVPVGSAPDGVGAEVSLRGLRFMGITMTGARANGFGTLNDKVNTICAPGDMICDSPPHALRLDNLISSIDTLINASGNPVHAAYAGFHVADGSLTATQWTEHWAADLIGSAPHPKHS